MMSWRKRALIGLAVLVIAIPAAWFGYGLIKDHLGISFEGGDDPLAYVEVINDTGPDNIQPEVFERLDRETKTRWRVEYFRSETQIDGAVQLKGNPDLLARLRKQMLVPSIEQFDVYQIATNALDQESVRQNGALYIIGFLYRAGREEWLRPDRDIFVNKSIGSGHTTYLTGSYVTYYAPPARGGKDQTMDVERFLRQLPTCSKNADPCPLPDEE